MFTKILEAINLRFFNYSSSPNQRQMDNKFFVENAIAWFKDSLQHGEFASKYSMLWNKYFPSSPENAAGWISTLIQLKKNYPELYDKYFGQKNTETNLVDWLLAVQRPDGTFPSSFEELNDQPPGIFVNGRITSGLLSYYKIYKDEKLLSAILKSAQWMLQMQMNDGSWKHYNFNTPHVNTLSAHTLMKLGKHLNDEKFIIAGKKNIDYTIRQQKRNGHFSDLTQQRITHYSETIGFTLNGILLCMEEMQDDSLTASVVKCYQPIINLIKKDGYLPGEIDDEFRTPVNYCCLPGNCLMSSVGFKLHKQTGDELYKTAAGKLLQYVKEKQLRSRYTYLNGGIAGSWPISGKFNPYEIHSSAVRCFTNVLLEQHSFYTGRLLS